MDLYLYSDHKLYVSVPLVSLMMLGGIKWNVQMVSANSRCALSAKNL